MKACPSNIDLKAYAVGKLSPEREELVADHVENCSECETKLQAFESHGDSLIGRLRLSTPANPYTSEPEFQQIAQLVERQVVAHSQSTASHGNDSSLPCPGRFHDYDLISLLGEGGMGTVYKAQHRHLKKLVAIKILPPSLAKDPERVARFKREMQAVGQLDEPHIVRAIGGGLAEGRHFLAMEYVEGLDLSEICRRVGRLPIADACEIARSVAIGLKVADERGLIHRDIKPSNLMITRDGHVKILDLGLAVFEDDRKLDSGTTSPGQILGTPDYIAPEQITSASTVDIRADIYSLGCTLFRFLAGDAPFSGPQYPGVVEIMAAHLRDPVPPIAKQRTDVPAKLAGIIERTLEKDRDLRIPTPGRLADDLRAFCGGADLAGLYAKAAKAEEAARERSVAATASFREGDSQVDTPVATNPIAAQAPAAPAGPFDPYHKWLGIAPKDQPPTHYKLLGLEPFESDREVIQSAVMRQSAHVRTFQLGQHSTISQRILNEISAAKICLLDKDKKKLYDTQLRKNLASAKERSAEPLAAAPAARVVASPTDHSGIDLSGIDQAPIELTNPELIESPSQAPDSFDVESYMEGIAASAKPTLPPQPAIPEWLTADNKLVDRSSWLTADDDDELNEKSPGIATRLWNSAKQLPASAKLLALKVIAGVKAIKWRDWSAVQWTAIGAAFAGVLALATILLSLHTPSGTVTIEVTNAPMDFQALLDGNSIDIKGLKDPLSIKVGEHDLEVNAANFQTFTHKFSVSSGSESKVTVTLEPIRLPIPKPSETASREAKSPVNPSALPQSDPVTQEPKRAVAPFDAAQAKAHQIA